jgi:hypothetical protein
MFGAKVSDFAKLSAEALSAFGATGDVVLLLTCAKEVLARRRDDTSVSTGELYTILTPSSRG